MKEEATTVVTDKKVADVKVEVKEDIKDDVNEKSNKPTAIISAPVIVAAPVEKKEENKTAEEPKKIEETKQAATPAVAKSNTELAKQVKPSKPEETK